MEDRTHEIDGWLIAYTFDIYGRSMEVKEPEETGEVVWWVPTDLDALVLVRVVYDGGSKARCPCPDFRGRNHWCKHLWAAYIALIWSKAEGASEAEFRLLVSKDERRYFHLGKPKKPPRPTHSRNWPSYNKVQAEERRLFRMLLFELCKDFEAPLPGVEGGKPRKPLSDVIYTLVFSVYRADSSSRRIDLELPLKEGFVREPLKKSTITKYMDSEETTLLLEKLIVATTRPFEAIETAFAPDGTGIKIRRKRRVLDKKSHRYREYDMTVDLHVMAGQNTKAIVAAVVTEKPGQESVVYPMLHALTANRFTIKEVAADKAYRTKKVVELIGRSGAQPFIPPKSDEVFGAGGEWWQQTQRYFVYRQNDFWQHYHGRSKVEAIFSAFKTRFWDKVRSRKMTPVRNEILCKVICWNIVRLMYAVYDTGIRPDFWPELEGPLWLELPERP